MYIRNFLAMYDNLDAECLDVGTLCTKANNKWSKYKPVRLNSNVNFENWWKANDGNCGFQIPEYGTIDDLFIAMRANTPVWNYLKPRGGEFNEPYRLLDFELYSTDSRPPLVRVKLNNNLYLDDNTIYNIVNGTTATAYELTLQDIGPTYSFDTMYLGVGLSKVGTTSYNYMTTSTQIGNQNGASINYPMPTTAGSYDLVFFLCEVAKPNLGDVFPTNVFYPLPDPIQRINLTDALEVNLSGLFNLANEQADYTLTINNLSTEQRILNNCRIAFRYGNNLPTNNPEVGEDDVTLGSISVNGGSVQVRTGTMYGVGADYNTKGGAYIYFSNTTNSKYNIKVFL